MSDKILPEIPQGLTMSLAKNANAMSRFGSLSKGEQLQVINYIETSTSGDQAKQRISEVVSELEKESGMPSFK